MCSRAAVVSTQGCGLVEGDGASGRAGLMRRSDGLTFAHWSSLRGYGRVAALTLPQRCSRCNRD
jgi:hypothetical protein